MPWVDFVCEDVLHWSCVGSSAEGMAEPLRYPEERRAPRPQCIRASVPLTVQRSSGSSFGAGLAVRAQAAPGALPCHARPCTAPSERGGGPGSAPRPGQAPPLPAGCSAEGRAGAGGAARRRTPAGAMSSHRSESDWQGLVSEVRRREGMGRPCLPIAAWPAGPALPGEGQAAVRGSSSCGPLPPCAARERQGCGPGGVSRAGPSWEAVQPLLHGVSPLSAASSVPCRGQPCCSVRLR